MTDKTDTPLTEEFLSRNSTYMEKVYFMRKLERQLADLKSEASQFKAKLAEARKDSERLDWLGANGGVLNALSSRAMEAKKGCYVSYMDEVCEVFEPTVRQAIDAAIRDSQTEEGE